MSTEFEFDAKVKEADDIDIKEYSFSPTLLENGVIDYSNIEHDKIFLVNKHDILEKEKPDWIPELDLDGLMADEFLPTTIKSSDGFYYVQAKKFIGMGTKSVEIKELIGKNKTVEIQEKKYETTVYKMSSDILAATVDYYIKKQKALNKQVGKKETVGLPRRTKSMYTSRFQNMVDLLRFIPEYKENEALLKHYPNRSKSEAYRKQNKIIFSQYTDLLGVLKDKLLDLNLDKIDYGNAYTKGEVTSYGDTGLSNSLYKDFGVRIKKQNGSTFSLEQKNRVESVLKDTYSYYGDLSNISKDFHLKLSYADNCRQHARKAIGLFTPYHNAIGVSFFDDNTYERTTAVHEFAHFLDYTKGNEFSYRYASDKDGSLENQIATKYKKLIREQNENNKSKVGESKTIKLGDYWYRTCECFARAMEQDFELTIGLKEKCEPPAYLPEEIFNKEIKPLIEELKKENEIKLNLIPGKFVTLTTKIKGNVMEQTKDYETLENVFEDNKLIDSIFQTVSKEFNEKNKDFFNFYEEEKSEQIENLSKNISNIKEKMLFSKIHSEMLKIRVEELKEMVKRCPNKDIALAVGIRYFNYFGNIEGNISHQNLYTRFGIGHYEKDQMVYPKPEELNSFISKLYENSKTQETYIWKHYEDGSCCLKAPNGEEYFVYDPDADEVKITKDSNWIRIDELNLGDKTFTQYAEDYVLEKNAATYISFETNGKNIEKKQNVDESKQYSFFVKDTAEFEMFEEFQTITGLTAKEAISEYKRLREDGLKAGIGINIPSDTTFDDPKGLGTTILVRENGVDTFDIYGDSFIVDLKENNERSQNRIAAYKELYEELQRAGLNVKEPKFLFDKHLELNNYKDSGEISIYRNKIFQINWLVKTLNISSETADMFYDNYTAYEEVGKNYPDWNYEKNTITIFEERNNKLDYYEISPLEICEIALKHAKNKEEIEIIKTVMSKQNSLEKGNDLKTLIEKRKEIEDELKDIEQKKHFQGAEAAKVSFTNSLAEINQNIENKVFEQLNGKLNKKDYPGYKLGIDTYVVDDKDYFSINFKNEKNGINLSVYEGKFDNLYNIEELDSIKEKTIRVLKVLEENKLFMTFEEKVKEVFSSIEIELREPEDKEIFLQQNSIYNDILNVYRNGKLYGKVLKHNRTDKAISFVDNNKESLYVYGDFVQVHHVDLVKEYLLRKEAKGIYEELIISPEENWKLDKELLSKVKEADKSKRPSSSIWGTAQSCSKIIPGVYTVTTAGHGGLLVHKSVADLVLSEEAKKEGSFYRNFYQFEEDNLISIPLLEMYHKHLCETLPWNVEKKDKLYKISQRDILRNEPEYAKYFYETYNKHPQQTKNTYIPKPVTLEEILSVMDLRVDISDSGKIKIFDNQRGEYIDNGEDFEGNENEAYEFTSASEIFERLDSYINDYFINDMVEQLNFIGVGPASSETLEDLCRIFKNELEKGNTELSEGELNMVMGIVEPNTVIMPEILKEIGDINNVIEENSDIQSVPEFVSQTMKDFMDGRVMPKIDSYRINHNHDYFLSENAIALRMESAKDLIKAFFVENWEQSSKDEFVQKAMESTLEPNSTVLFDKYLKEKEVEVYTKEEQEKMEQANNSIKEIVEQYSKELFETYNQKEKLNKFWSEADIVDTVPYGWKKDQGVTTVPNGYVAITNGKSRFADGEKRETKIIREEKYKQTELELDFGLIPMMPKIELKEPEKQIIKEEVKLPFSIINNVEKGRVNIKFDQKISDKKFNSILKELKSAGWRFSSFNKQWYPVGKAVEKSETFVKELQEKYANSEETITYATASFEEFSQTLTESQIQKSPYNGIKFFDRNYKEIDEFVAYFNRNLNVFGKDVEPIDEKIAETIFESLQVDRVGTLNSRTIRLGLDASDNLVLLNKEKNEIETKQISLKELFSLARETLEKSKEELDKSINNLYQNDNKEQLVNILEKLFQTAKRNNTELINKMDVIYEAYIKEPTQQTKKISKVKPLKIGDSIGDEVVQDVFEIAKGVYQATLIKDMNKGAFAPGTFFVLDKNIVEKLNPDLHQFLEDKGERAIFETSCRTTPHIIKELIDKKLCPPRDNEYYQQLVLHTEKNPLKYEVLYPVTKYNFKNKLKQIYEIDKHVNNDVLNMGKQLLSLATEGDKKEISKWLKDDVGCEDEKTLKNVFTNWVSEKEIKQEKKKDGYPPRGE